MIFSRDINRKLYDRREEFNFFIVNFPYLCSNLPSSPVFDVVYVLYVYIYTLEHVLQMIIFLVEASYL